MTDQGGFCRRYFKGRDGGQNTGEKERNTGRYRVSRARYKGRDRQRDCGKDRGRKERDKGRDRGRIE